MNCASCENAECTCDERELDVLYVSPERFARSPQVGVQCRMTWGQLGLYLSRPSVGEAKDAAGAWSPALYRDGIRRKSALVSIGALVVDVDENGDVDVIASAVSRYRSIVHETFSSTNDAPRCRLVLELHEHVDAATYELAHVIVRAHLLGAGIVADLGAKDASRVSYSPVRRPGASYRFARTEGRPFDAKRAIAAQPPRTVREAPRPPKAEHRDRYIRGALQRAADEVRDASEGVRHYTLAKESFGLARLGLSEDEIAAVLLPAFVAAAGEHRAHEGRRTICDAIRARRGAA